MSPIAPFDFKADVAARRPYQRSLFRGTFVFARCEQMAEKAARDQEDDAGYSGERRVH